MKPELIPVEGYHEDKRGTFSRLFDRDQHPKILQVNSAFTAEAGTIRGLHFLAGCPGEEKRVRLLLGRVHDVCVDLRPWSETFGGVFEYELEAGPWELVIPPHFAHGYQTLEDNVVMTYGVTARYLKSADSGVSPLSPSLQIKWPRPPKNLSERDKSLPDFLLDESGQNCVCI